MPRAEQDLPHEHDAIAAAFDELPAIRVPGTLMPRLMRGVPAQFPVVTERKSPGLRMTTWITGGALLAASIAFAAVVTHQARRPESPTPEPNQAIAIAEWSALATDMRTFILKDTDPCRILPAQSN